VQSVGKVSGTSKVPDILGNKKTPLFKSRIEAFIVVIVFKLELKTKELS
jgi:hypothetical protein